MMRMRNRDRVLYTNSESGSPSKLEEVRLGSFSGRMLFTWLMLAGFILFFAPRNLTNKLQFAFVRIFHLPLNLGRSVSISARGEPLVAEVVSRGLYNRLQNHLANVTEQLYQEHQVVEVLSGLRNRFALEGAKLVCADVITTSIGTEHSELIINRGENDGLARGQFVLSDNSIVGTISDISPRTAQVRLFTDPDSKIAVKIGSVNTERLIHGIGDDSAKVKLLSRKYKVKVGDKVLALKKPGFLDAPIIIGVVVKCVADDVNPSLWDVTVKPVCDIEQLKTVSVIIMNPSGT
ncbi:MAG: rod shape-determining protein MreC [Phycisphaerae bacterium]|nr:rod shape-determining protein MreC [Phycisphaerae bacterium]